MNTYNTVVPVTNNVIFDIQLIAVRASGFAFVKKKILFHGPFSMLFFYRCTASCLVYFDLYYKIEYFYIFYLTTPLFL